MVGNPCGIFIFTPLYLLVVVGYGASFFYSVVMFVRVESNITMHVRGCESLGELRVLGENDSVSVQAVGSASSKANKKLPAVFNHSSRGYPPLQICRGSGDYLEFSPLRSRYQGHVKAGEPNLRFATSAGSSAFFGTATGKIIKVDLSSRRLVGTSPELYGGRAVKAGVVHDDTGIFITAGGVLVQVDLADMRITNTTHLNGGFISAILTHRGLAYCRWRNRILKIDIKSMEVVQNSSLPAETSTDETALVSNGFAFFGGTELLKVSLDTLQLVDSISFNHLSARSGLVFNDYGFFAAVGYVANIGRDMSKLFKVDLEAMQIVDEKWLHDLRPVLCQALLGGEYAFVVMSKYDGRDRIVRFNLVTFQMVGELIPSEGLQAGWQIRSAVLHAGYGYFGTLEELRLTLCRGHSTGGFDQTFLEAEGVTDEWRTITLGMPPGVVTYYELMLLDDFYKLQVGWAMSGFACRLGKHRDEYMGVGDCKFSWGLDGARGIFWHKGRNKTGLFPGRPWKGGDVIGCALDRKEQKMRWYVNGTETFTFAISQEVSALFPAFSLNKGGFAVRHVSFDEFPPVPRRLEKPRELDMVEVSSEFVSADAQKLTVGMRGVILTVGPSCVSILFQAVDERSHQVQTRVKTEGFGNLRLLDGFEEGSIVEVTSAFTAQADDGDMLLAVGTQGKVRRLSEETAFMRFKSSSYRVRRQPVNIVLEYRHFLHLKVLQHQLWLPGAVLHFDVAHGISFNLENSNAQDRTIPPNNMGAHSLVLSSTYRVNGLKEKHLHYTGTNVPSPQDVPCRSVFVRQPFDFVGDHQDCFRYNLADTEIIKMESRASIVRGIGTYLGFCGGLLAACRCINNRCQRSFDRSSDYYQAAADSSERRWSTRTVRSFTGESFGFQMAGLRISGRGDRTTSDMDQQEQTSPPVV